MGEAGEYTIQWGGYYASQEESGDYRLFRLLDFNIQAYHASLFSQTFAHLPTLDDALTLSPFIWHAPIDARGFVNRNPVLLGGPPLNRDALEGYAAYLEHHGVSGEELTELLDRVIGFSQAEPMTLILEIVDGELVMR